MSKLRFKHVITTLLLLCLLPGLGSACLAQGRRGRKKKGKKSKTSSRATLVLFSGRLTKGVSVKEAKYSTIKYRQRGSRSTQEIKADKVREIRYSSPPAQYASGRSQYRAGQYEKAAASFTKARSSAEKGRWVWVYSTYWLGQSQLLGKNYSDAEAEFKRVIEKEPGHFLAPAAIYGLGLAQIGSAPKKAITTLSKLNEGYGDYWRARCQLGVGDAYLALKKPTDARKGFGFAKSRGRSFPEIMGAAKVGEGKAYILDKSWDRAIQFFDQIINDSTATPGAAGNAWVGKGDCLLQKAKQKGNDKNLLKEALIAYQNCAVRYAGIPGAYPKSLYQSASLYDKLGLANIAKLQRDELKSRCPSSSWAEKLKK